MTLDMPDAVVHALRLPRKGTKEELIRMLAVTLYARGILGIGTARELAGAATLELPALLRREEIPPNYDQQEAEGDIRTVRGLSL